MEQPIMVHGVVILPSDIELITPITTEAFSYQFYARTKSGFKFIFKLKDKEQLEQERTLLINTVFPHLPLHSVLEEFFP